jgi:hypothetical protein
MAGISWEKVISMLPQLGLALVAGGAGGAVGGAVSGAAGGGRGGKGIAGMTFSYPDLPGDFNYPMVVDRKYTRVDGKNTVLPSLNSRIDRNNLAAAMAQDLVEHNLAVKGGYEKNLDQWWPGEDRKPRKVISPSSSAIEGIMIGKDGDIQVKWLKGSKWYSYRGGRDLRDTSRIVQELLSSPSIGRALVRKGRLAHADSKDLTGEPVADKNVGWWARKYFNPAKVGGTNGMILPSFDIGVRQR